MGGPYARTSCRRKATYAARTYADLVPITVAGALAYLRLPPAAPASKLLACSPDAER